MEALQFAEGAILQGQSHRDVINSRDQHILRCAMSLSPILVQCPVQYPYFRATQFYNRFFFVDANNSIYLSAAMQGNNDPLAEIPQPTNADIVYMHLITTGVDFTFSIDYAGRDQMTLSAV